MIAIAAVALSKIDQLSNILNGAKEMPAGYALVNEPSVASPITASCRHRVAEENLCSNRRLWEEGGRI